MRLQGWILDLYPSPQGMTLWLIEQNQKRHRLIDAFSPAFFVHGSRARLSRLQDALSTRSGAVKSQLTERTDLWQHKALQVLEVSVRHPTEFNSWVRWVHRFDPQLRLYNSDLMLVPLYCWEKHVFPFAQVEVEVGRDGRVQAVECQDSEWALDYKLPPLKIMHLRLEGLSWQHKALQVLEVSVRHPTEFNSWVRWVHRFDPQLRLYNSDLMLVPLYCWEKHVFPFAQVEVEVGRDGRVQAVECQDSEWALDYKLPPLKIMHLRLEGLSDINPRHGRRGALEVEVEGNCCVIEESGEPAVVTFHHLLRRHDPDLILSEWGDSTILPLLRQQARRLDLPLELNRDAHLPVQQSRARSFMSYGRILFKASATTLYGRLHVERSGAGSGSRGELLCDRRIRRAGCGHIPPPSPAA